MAEKGIATLADVLEYEKVPFDQRLKAFNTYDLIKYGASLNPDGWALTFILSGEHYAEPMQVNYRDLVSNINRSANLFHDLGIGADKRSIAAMYSRFDSLPTRCP